MNTNGETQSVRIKKEILDEARKIAEKEDTSLRAVIERSLRKLFPKRQS